MRLEKKQRRPWSGCLETLLLSTVGAVLLFTGIILGLNDPSRFPMGILLMAVSVVLGLVAQRMDERLRPNERRWSARPRSRAEHVIYVLNGTLALGEIGWGVIANQPTMLLVGLLMACVALELDEAFRQYRQLEDEAMTGGKEVTGAFLDLRR